MKRNNDAIAISDGACNPVAIINAMARAVEEMREVGADHPAILADPALKLMVHQLAFLQGTPTNERFGDWMDWRKACEVKDA
jgi:hypothetical protein